MSLLKDNEKSRIIFFNCGSTVCFMVSLLLVLAWSEHFYLFGKYCFQYYILLIVVVEYCKHIVSTRYFQTPTVYIGKKNDNAKGNKIARSFNHSKLKEFFKTVGLLLVVTAFYFGISILFGAEVFSKHEETLMFSLLLAVLTALPIILSTGCNSFLQILIGVKPSNMLEASGAQSLFLTLGGAWCGAIAIPLDWDQAWQEWPIPCSFGAILGYIASQVLVIQRLFGWHSKKSIV